MASGFVGPTVGRLTCRVGKELVCCFHTPKSCPLLLRLALLLVFGLCVWKWTTSGGFRGGSRGSLEPPSGPKLFNFHGDFQEILSEIR